ncbi:MAG: helix-turn-helix domain-containing protein [Clostridia bacterium]|nr:helix-turn-helix domain-containing protein [Clostridia bacterium]
MAARMRTINEAAKELKAEDPATAVSAWTIRQMIKSGQLPYVPIGTKMLINMDNLERVLCSKEVSL